MRTWVINHRERGQVSQGSLDWLLATFAEYNWTLTNKGAGTIEFVGCRWEYDRFAAYTLKEVKYEEKSNSNEDCTDA